MNKEELEYGIKELEKIESEVKEIKKLQQEAEAILNDKNIFIRIFNFNKAAKLDEEASKRLLEVNKRLAKLPDISWEREVYRNTHNLCVYCGKPMTTTTFHDIPVCDEHRNL